MDKTLEKYIEELEMNDPASDTELDATQKTMNFIFPDDYKAFIKEANGADGGVGEFSYFVLWSLREVIDLNEEYEIGKTAPGLILFADNGDDEAYAYDTRSKNKEIVRLPFATMKLGDARKCAVNLKGLLDYMYNQK